jgi:hypothetical protein
MGGSIIVPLISMKGVVTLKVLEVKRLDTTGNNLVLHNLIKSLNLSGGINQLHHHNNTKVQHTFDNS